MTLSHSSMSSACGGLRILMPALLTRMSIRPSSRTVRSTMVATADLSVTSAPASASPHAMPRPMPPLPPVTIATLPLRSKSGVFIAVIPDVVQDRSERARLALALPDQDQADRGQRSAVSGPLDLADHEARLGPFDHAGTLADPEQAYGEREKANDQQRFTHCFSLVQPAASCGYRTTIAEWRARPVGARAGLAPWSCAMS